MKTLRSEIEIAAPAERVWHHLSDFDSFPSWNPFIRRAEGTLAPGSRLTIRLRVVDERTVTFRPRVTKVEPNRELRWLARLWLPRLFDVERVFRIEPRDGGHVRFLQSESCTGSLTPIMFAFGWLERSILRGYEDLGHALKARAERSAQG